LTCGAFEELVPDPGDVEGFGVETAVDDPELVVVTFGVGRGNGRRLARAEDDVRRLADAYSDS
jgi:hypothetical protein